MKEEWLLGQSHRFRDLDQGDLLVSRGQGNQNQRGWGHSSKARGQSIKSQRSILRSWNLMEFALLSCKLALDLWCLFSFEFLPFGMGLSVLHKSTIMSWKRTSCFLNAIWRRQRLEWRTYKRRKTKDWETSTKDRRKAWSSIFLRSLRKKSNPTDTLIFVVVVIKHLL